MHLGEGATYRRIEAARAARRFPLVLQLLCDGKVSLTAVSSLAQHLTEANHQQLLEAAVHKPTREVECMVAALAPKPDVPTLVRKLPAPTRDALSKQVAHPSTSVTPSSTPQQQSPPPRPVIAPLAPERFKLQVTMSQETHDTLRQLQNLMRHSIPSGDAAVIVERALKLLLQEVLRRKCGMRKRDLPALDPEQPEIGGHDRLIH